VKEKKKQKPHGMKHKIREEKKREARIAFTVVVSILLIAVVSISGFLINSMLSQPSTKQTDGSTSEPKAAIVDQLSLNPTTRNQTFTETATNILEQAGYTVKYYRGEEVTVDFYKNLPTHGYKIIILRTHSAPLFEDGKETEIVNLFTSELYSNSSHILEQQNDEVVIATYYEGSPKYFGITPSFIKNYMKGFNNATIIMMGCDGLKYNKTAEAFIENGAKVCVGWNGPVSVGHTDATTARFLHHLLIQKLTVREAVIQALRDVGPDPDWKSFMLFYPFEGEPYWE